MTGRAACTHRPAPPSSAVQAARPPTPALGDTEKMIFQIPPNNAADPTQGTEVGPTEQASYLVRNEIQTVVLWRHLSNPTSSLRRALAAYRQLDLASPCPRRAPRPVHRTIHRLTATEVDEAVAAYQAGMTLRKLGTRFSVSREAVTRNLKARGVPIRGRSMTPAEIEQAASLYAQGMSLAPIANGLGFRVATVHLALRAAGVAMRDTHGRER